MIFLYRISISIFLTIQLFPSLMWSQTSTEIIADGMELVIHEEYDNAQILFNDFIDKNPQDPAGHLFLASIWQSKMMDFETQVWRDLFLNEINKTIHLSDSVLQIDQANTMMQFYHASAIGYKSFQISREGNYIKGLRLALKAIDGFNTIIKQDSLFYDAYLGVGSYLYWRSYLTRNFAWLPFFKDQRKEGIALIQKSFEKGTFSRWAALSNLAWIYIQEERFEEAIRCAQTGLISFPNSRFFLWPLGDAQFKNNDFFSARLTYLKILHSVTAEEFNNRYNEIVLYLKIAQCHFELWDKSSAHKYAHMALTTKPDDEVKSRLEKKRKEASALMAKINSQLE